MTWGKGLVSSLYELKFAAMYGYFDRQLSHACMEECESNKGNPAARHIWVSQLRLRGDGYMDYEAEYEGYGGVRASIYSTDFR